MRAFIKAAVCLYFVPSLGWAQGYLPPPELDTPAQLVVIPTAPPVIFNPSAAAPSYSAAAPLPSSPPAAVLAAPAPVPAAPPASPTEVVTPKSPYLSYSEPVPVQDDFHNAPVTVFDRTGAPVLKSDGTPKTKDTLRVYSSVGMLTGSLNWAKGYNDQAPNILSELTYTDLKSYGIVSGAEYTCESGWCKNIKVLGTLTGFRSDDGDGRDSDYLGNNRTQEFSRSISDAKGSKISGGSLALAYDVAYDWGGGGISLIPSLGYSYDVQSMRMRGGKQIVSDGVIMTIPEGTNFSGLNSTYEARWTGGFAALEARLRFLSRHEFRAGYRLNESDYEGEGHWNLREDLYQPKSFEHFTSGSGDAWTAGYSVWLTPAWELRLDGKYEKWKAKGGSDVVYFADDTYAVLALQEAYFKAHSFTAGFGYRF